MVKRMTFVLMMLLLISEVPLGAAGENEAKQLSDAQQKQFLALKNQTLEMKVDTLVRDIATLTRRIERIEKQIERIDRDVKNLRFR